MKIKKIEFKNINSYGNNIQEITFDDDPGLILLFGENGSGKSTIKQVMDITLFGKTVGKNGKRLAIKELPNRRNGTLYTSIDFENHKSQQVSMTRWVKPNDFQITVNEEILTERFKTMSKKDRDNIIGYTYDIFKSFISININDFKNFISLNKEDKETLLNKLFNLNELDDLFSITKDIDKSNQSKIYEFEDLISDNEDLISEYNTTITNIIEKEKFSKEERKLEIKEEILNIKPLYTELNNQLNDIKEKKTKLNIKFSKLRDIKSDNERNKTKYELIIDNLNEKINTYNSGVCPVCDTILTDDSHITTLKTYYTNINDNKLEIETCNKFLNKCKIEDVKLKNINNTLYHDKQKIDEELNSLKITLGILNNEYKLLGIDDINDHSESISKISEKIDQLKKKNIEYQEIINDLEEKSNTYEELKKILSFDGIRKTLISNAIGPINQYLKNYLKRLNSEYSAILSDNFDATIYELETLKVNPETLSKGEDRKINIAIAISYLRIILDMKHSNIIFLDEIFDGISMNNIVLIIDILKELSMEYKTNIIIVAHGISEMKDFSNVVKKFSYTIETKKDIFSDLIIKKI